MIENYSRVELENIAEDLLRKFDSERLSKCKPIDVYEVVEKCLDVPYDWKYITPDQSILGLTAFQPGRLWVWPESHYEDGMLPEQIYLEKGTILIDSTLTEHKDRGMENFTVLHEVFHQVLHNQFFCELISDDANIYSTLNSGRRLPEPLNTLEYQANACAAAFLMPSELVGEWLRHYKINIMLNFDNATDRNILINMAGDFNTTKTAMKYRLINLGHAYPERWY